MKNDTAIVLNNPRTVNAWAFFDWANSAFALVITAAIFPAYFAAVTDDIVTVLGRTMSSSSLYAYAVSASYLVIALVSPLLSGIADFGGRRMFFLRFFTVMGALGCLSLFLFRGMPSLAIGVVGFIVAMIGFAGGLVFYNSYLPQIVTEDRYDRVSARGFSFGYIGSVLLLLVNLWMIGNSDKLGFANEGVATRLAFVMVGLWWIGFAQIPFRRLPADPKNRPRQQLITKGFAELVKVARIVGQSKNILRFLGAFFCYSAGVQTVLFLAATFAEKELKFETVQLIIIVLILQLVAVGGAYLFAKVSEWRGNKFSLLVMLVIWIGICFAANQVYTQTQFYILAGAVGLVMGGIQSLSRSTYSKLIPADTKDTASFFSFYDVLEKVAIVIGTFSFGFIEQITGSMRSSVLVLGVFFVLGFVILAGTRIRHAGGGADGA
ncbi:MAG: MFS transporter [Saprospiraceae bacterium]|nr:MFS transporter [Saprospiraceae bacterium]